MKNAFALTSIATIAVAGGLAFATYSSAQDSSRSINADAAVSEQAVSSKQITIWRDPSCGCCDSYATYLEEKGYQVARVDDPAFDRRSVEAGVPEQGLGCHLAKIDGYYVSGLVPEEIIERLVTERPQIAGITLPGMPANAPGMAREKSGTLKTYAFGKNGITVYSDE
ncbi:DUF411 domain-containing protein [Pseudohoeflea coraliihabitans]|uniref:Metal-binding protein n=1 Tax=Pseudohoeflea coraliihabitans TaxID=2860393 RepID=A0ABS6WP43_9HYPH|nr:DUF411 domain-containing protein [Pseudohoeflea sp. DP4N28-3]MBW3097742.1 metal-binding protein [Pseudohoeflea sp. DP4N28-3]